MMVEQSDERDALRARLAGMWAAVAGGWGAARRLRRRARSAERGADARAGARWAPATASSSSPAGRAGSGSRPPSASGPAARSSSPTSPSEMTAIAAARAAELGLGNVAFRRLDLERIDEPDASYDVVLCREGLMFALEPGPRRRRDPAGAAPRRPRRGRRVGGARAQPVARPRDGRRQRADRGAGAAARDPGPVRARRRRRAAPPPRRRGPGRRAGRRALRARCGPPRSTSGGRGRRRSRARCRRSSRRCPRRPCRRCASAPARPCAAYENASGGLDFPGVALIAAGRRA